MVLTSTLDSFFNHLRCHSPSPYT